MRAPIKSRSYGLSNPQQQRMFEMVSTSDCVYHPVARVATDRANSGMAALVRRLTMALVIARERRALMALSDDALKDIGLSRADAYHEGTRSFWDLPSDRLR
jgi:uncharacterized protein YjiS (DUF1127 family)